MGQSIETVNGQLDNLVKQNIPILDPKTCSSERHPFPVDCLQICNGPFLGKVNSIYLVHAVKRMLKGVRIQIEDYQSLIGFFNINNG